MDHDQGFRCCWRRITARASSGSSSRASAGRPSRPVNCGWPTTDRATRPCGSSRNSPRAPAFLSGSALNTTAGEGQSDNVLNAAPLCEGEVIAFCDQDDIWHPEKLQRCVEALAAEDALLCVHSAHS
ncbi:MAG: glycosyltransferase [Piscinibacter sp.]